MLLENFFIVKKRGDWVTSPRFERFKSHPRTFFRHFQNDEITFVNPTIWVPKVIKIPL